MCMCVIGMVHLFFSQEEEEQWPKQKKVAVAGGPKINWLGQVVLVSKTSVFISKCCLLSVVVMK